MEFPYTRRVRIPIVVALAVFIASWGWIARDRQPPFISGNHSIEIGWAAKYFQSFTPLGSDDGPLGKQAEDVLSFGPQKKITLRAAFETLHCDQFGEPLGSNLKEFEPEDPRFRRLFRACRELLSEEFHARNDVPLAPAVATPFTSAVGRAASPATHKKTEEATPPTIIVTTPDTPWWETWVTVMSGLTAILLFVHAMWKDIKTNRGKSKPRRS